MIIQEIGGLYYATMQGLMVVAPTRIEAMELMYKCVALGVDQ